MFVQGSQLIADAVIVRCQRLLFLVADGRVLDDEARVGRDVARIVQAQQFHLTVRHLGLGRPGVVGLLHNRVATLPPPARRMG